MIPFLYLAYVQYKIKCKNLWAWKTQQLSHAGNKKNDL